MARNRSKPKKQGGLSKLRSAYRMTKEHDKHIGLICLAWFLGVGLLVGLPVGWFFHWAAGVVLGLPSGWLAALVVFGRRAQNTAYAQVEGRPGAAAAALSMLKRGWKVQPAVSVTKNQDLVHRVVGRPGVILVGEGNPGRVRNLLAVEKKKHARVVGEVPIYDLVVGEDGDGALPVKKLTKHIMKLPRNVSPAEVTDLQQRLKALDAMRPQVPIPKGPIPTSMKQARSAMRGPTPRSR